MPRALISVKEKLSTETSYSEEIALFFHEQRRAEMEDIVLPYVYHGATFEMFIHIDAGTDMLKNKTAMFVDEMVRRVESMGMVPIVKPDSYVVSSYANKFSKLPYQAAEVMGTLSDGSI